MATKSLNDMSPKQAARAIIKTMLMVDSSADIKEFYPEANTNQIAQVVRHLEMDINRITTRYGYEAITIRRNT